jgi:deoxyribonuclease IV
MALIRPVGAHCPTAGGLAHKTLPYVDATEAEAAQLYVSNSRGWALPSGDPAQDIAFRDGCDERGLPVYIHASLLVNLASPSAETLERSVATLAHAVSRGVAIGATGVVFHAGSAVEAGRTDAALAQVREALLPLLDTTASVRGPRLLVEPSAGGGRSLASRVEHLEPYLDAVGRHPWLGVCFDTCHAWAAGHDVARPGGMAETLEALVTAVGADRLWLVHANDSKDLCGSARDRHESIGKGSLGELAFAELMAHPAVAGIPVIVETPTDGPAGHGGDIEVLKRLRTFR